MSFEFGRCSEPSIVPFMAVKTDMEWSPELEQTTSVTEQKIRQCEHGAQILIDELDKYIIIWQIL